MDEEVNPSSGVMLLVAFALLGVALGGAGLYFGFTANQRLAPVEASAREGSSLAEGLEDELEGASTRLSELSARIDDFEQTLKRVRIYQRQAESTVSQLTATVKENRQQIVKVAEKYNALADRTPAPRRGGGGGSGEDASGTGRARAPADGAAETADRSGGGDGAAAATGGSYTVEAGDNFSRIAKKVGVSLGALLEANPDADPRRLRIGQTINLPPE